MKKKFKVLFAIVMITSLIAGCSSGTSAPDNSSGDADSQLKEFTMEEVAEYDGKDGAKVYVVVDGYVYDFTNSRRWKNGSHDNGNHMAGMDLTEELKSASPHGLSVLSKFEKVGKIKE